MRRSQCARWQSWLQYATGRHPLQQTRAGTSVVGLPHSWQLTFGSTGSARVWSQGRRGTTPPHTDCGHGGGMGGSYKVLGSGASRPQTQTSLKRPHCSHGSSTYSSNTDVPTLLSLKDASASWITSPLVHLPLPFGLGRQLRSPAAVADGLGGV